MALSRYCIGLAVSGIVCVLLMGAAAVADAAE
jgi:hypothetical protein